MEGVGLLFFLERHKSRAAAETQRGRLPAQKKEDDGEKLMRDEAEENNGRMVRF